MALNIGDNFKYQGKKPNFERDSFATKAEMKGFPEANVDEGHISFCEEDGKHYEFKAGNSVDTNTGKWREFTTNVDLSGYATKTEVQQSVANKVDKSYVDGKVDVKQDKLADGINIKTINGQPIMGKGNITIAGPDGQLDLSGYATKTEMLNNITDYNVSKHHPTEGIGGTNKFTLESAIKLIPESLRSVGIKCSFLDNADEQMKIAVYQGSTFTDKNSWQYIGALGVDTESIQIGIKNATSNIIDDISLSYNGYIDNNGIFASHESVGSASDFISVSNCLKIEYKLSCNGAAIIAFYDKDKKFLKSESVFDSDDLIKVGTIDIPSNAAFVRYCNHAPTNKNPYFYIFTNPVKKRLDVLDAAVQSKTDLSYVHDIINKNLWGDTSMPKIGYISSSGGFVDTKESDTSFQSSDFIRITQGDNIDYALSCNGACIVAFYDKDKKFIPDSSVKDTTGIIHKESVIAPKNVSYVRFSNYKESNAHPSIVFATTALSARVEEKLEVIVSSYNLADSIRKPIVFNGKKLVAFGDSITAGVCSPNLRDAGENKYINVFCSLSGATLVTNYAVGGSCITDADNVNNSIYDNVLSYTGDADIIWIAGGTNDWNTGKAIGTFESTEPKTFYGALRNICEHLKKNTPNAVVIFVTPIPYTNKNTYKSILPLDVYRSAIYEVATLYGFNVVDGKNLGMPYSSGNWNNKMCDDNDGCHPTIEGHKLYARNLLGKLM